MFLQPNDISPYIMNKQNERQQIEEEYKEQQQRLAQDISRREAKAKYFITAEILLFAAAVGTAIAYLCGAIEVTEFILTFCPACALFCGTKAIDRRNDGVIDEQKARLAVCEDNLRYMAGDFSKFDAGERYADAAHPYSFDMDIFGTESLFQRICRAATTGGADTLASMLSTAATPLFSHNVSAGSIKSRAEAVGELTQMKEWRAAFLAEGKKTDIDTDTLRKTLDELRRADIPQAAIRKATIIGISCSMLLLAVLAALAMLTDFSADAACLWAAVQLFASIAMSAKAINKISRKAEKIMKSAKGFVSLLDIIGKAEFKAERNKEIAATLSGESGDALRAMKELSGITDAFDRRGNILGLVIFNALCFSDVFIVRRFLKWQSRNMEQFPKWIAAVGEIDAMVSMATMQYNEPSAVEAEITDDEKTVFDARGIRHPFLGEKAVRNDFRLDDGNYYIITGANMAGKSTFLRAVGVNYILAMCGMPVFADSMTVSVFNLFTSMRTSDDLSRGISYFNAELLRLRHLLDNVRRAPRTLIILDEILKGTNSLDKLNGSRMFLDHVANLPVTGIIATHDLELSKMADERPDRFHNFCFEIKLQDDITYSYKITPGVARNQNASYLLRGILDKQ